MGPGFSPLKDKKFLSIIFLFLLFSISIPLMAFLFRDQIKQGLYPLNPSFQTAPKIVSQGKITSLIGSDHPSIFYVYLVYNPQAGTTNQLKIGLSKGDPFPLSSKQPQVSSESLDYRIEVLSSEKMVLQSGWKTQLKKFSQTKEGEYRLSFGILYKPGLTVRVIWPGNKVIWTGVMPKS